MEEIKQKLEANPADEKAINELKLKAEEKSKKNSHKGCINSPTNSKPQGYTTILSKGSTSFIYLRYEKDIGII